MHQRVDQAGHLRRVRVLVQRPAHGHARTPTFHDVAHLVQHVVAARLGARTPEEEDRHADAGHHPGDGALTVGAGLAVGTGTLMTGAPMSWAITAASTTASVSRRMPPIVPDQRLNQGLEPRIV